MPLESKNFEKINTDLSGTSLEGFEKGIDALCEVGRLFYDRGWSVGTSSNYSIVLCHQPLELLITVSGKDKGHLSRSNFVRVNADGVPIVANQPQSSTETMLHVIAAQNPNVGAVLHTHSIWGTLLSDLYFKEGGFKIEGYEMLKGLTGVTTHEHSEWVPIFNNTQDIPILAEQVNQRMNSTGIQHGYLILRHGLYTWGQNLDEAKRHIEIFEFLFECIVRRLILVGALPASSIIS